jgi:hypothetical protein
MTNKATAQNCYCKEHEAIKVRLDHAEQDNKDQWKEINGMKRFIMTTLVMVSLTLMGVLFNLAITLAK